MEKTVIDIIEYTKARGYELTLPDFELVFSTPWFHRYSVKQTSPGLLTISTKDQRKNLLIFKASVIQNAVGDEDRCLVDFRLSKGDGLEFKRLFVHFKKGLGSLVLGDPKQLGTTIKISEENLPPTNVT